VLWNFVPPGVLAQALLRVQCKPARVHSVLIKHHLVKSLINHALLLAVDVPQLVLVQPLLGASSSSCLVASDAWCAPQRACGTIAFKAMIGLGVIHPLALCYIMAACPARCCSVIVKKGPSR
jgi:hypothetical protein